MAETLISVAARSTAARFLGGGIESRQKHGRLSVVSVMLSGRSLRRADHSNRGVLPSVVCLKAEITRGYFTRNSPASSVAS